MSRGRFASLCEGISSVAITIALSTTHLRPTAACFRSDRQRRNAVTAIATPHSIIEPTIVSLLLEASYESTHPNFLNVVHRSMGFLLCDIFRRMLCRWHSCNLERADKVSAYRPASRQGRRTLQTGRLLSRQKSCCQLRSVRVLGVEYILSIESSYRKSMNLTHMEVSELRHLG
jgi:hypothetical protein